MSDERIQTFVSVSFFNVCISGKQNVKMLAQCYTPSVVAFGPRHLAFHIPVDPWWNNAACRGQRAPMSVSMQWRQKDFCLYRESKLVRLADILIPSPQVPDRGNVARLHSSCWMGVALHESLTVSLHSFYLRV
jgi:hypothetical protein